MKTEMENIRQFVKDILGKMTLFSSVPLRATALQYLIHSVATISLILSSNLASGSCEDIITLDLAKSRLEEIRTLQLNLMDICLNKTTLDHFNTVSKRVILLEEFFIFFALSCFVLNGRKTEKVVSMTCLVTVLLLKLSSSVVLPVKLQLEDFLTHTSGGFIHAFLYPFKLLTWMIFNLVSLPLANLTLKGIILDQPVSLDDAIRNKRDGLFGDLLNGSDSSTSVSYSWFQYFVPWGKDIETKSSETFSCREFCGVDIPLQPVIATFMLTFHFVYVIFVLLPGFLELSTAPELTCDHLKEKQPKLTAISDRINTLRFSFDERSHRQSFADEGFGESSSMETVAIECITKESTTTEILRTDHIHIPPEKAQKPLFHQITEDEGLSEEISSREVEQQTEEFIEDIENEGQRYSPHNFKNLIETNFNNQPYICLKTDAMRVVCDKLFTSKSNYFATSTSDELLRGFSGENPCKLDWQINQKQLANDGLDKLYEWHREKMTNNCTSDVSCFGYENDGYSDDESFINGFRL